MKSVPDVEASLPPIFSAASKINGWLSPREVRFLTFLMAYPSTNGRVVELGCYHGKSTVVLAMASNLTNEGTLISVDPIEETQLMTNLERFGVSDKVQFVNTRSDEFWLTWNQSIRLLWHDGANDRVTVSQDVKSAVPWLSDGAIIAFHDVLNTSGERIHVYIDEILGSPHFGASGVVGSIGWSQYRTQTDDATAYQPLKRKLKRKLERLRPFADLNKPQGGRFWRYRYKLLRSFVPHGIRQINEWMRAVQIQEQQN